MATNWEDFGFGDYTALKLPTPTQMKIPQMKGVGGVVGSKNPTYEAPQVAVSDPTLPEITANPAPALQVMPTPTIQLPQYQMPDTSKVVAPVAVSKPVDLETAKQDLVASGLVPGPEQAVQKPAPVVQKPVEQSPTPMDKQMYQKAKVGKDKTLELPEDWSKSDVDKASKIAEKHGMTPGQLFGIFAVETGHTYSTSIKNNIGATGLIQFTPTTGATMLMEKRREDAVEAARQSAKESGADEKVAVKQALKANPLYWQLSDNDQKRARAAAQESLSKMNVDKQLDVVDFYLGKAGRGAKGVEDIYTAVFTGNPNTREIKAGTAAYKYNSGYDLNKDGVITKEEWTSKVKDIGDKIQAINARQPKHDSMASTNEKGKTEDISKKTTPEQLRQDIMPMAKLAYPTSSKEDQKAMERIRATPIIWEDGENRLPEKDPTGGRVLGVYRTPNYEQGDVIPLDPGAHVVLKPQMGGVEDARAILAHELVGHAGQLRGDQYDAAPIKPFPNQPDTIGPILQGNDVLNAPTPAATRIKTVAKAAELGKASLDAEQQRQVETDFGWVQRGMMELLGLTPPKPSSALDLEMQLKSNLPRTAGTPESEVELPKPKAKKPKK
jgi:hypothetical protein